MITIPNESFLDWEKKHHPKERDKDLEMYKRNSLGISNKAFKLFIQNWKKKNLKPSTDPSGTKTKHSKGDKVIGRGVVPPPDGDTKEDENEL